MKGWSKAPTQIGLAMVGLGFLAIVLGWNGAASYNNVQQQFPYLISGGIAGVALVFGGIGLIVTQSSRRDNLMLQAKLDDIATAMDRLSLNSGGPTAVPGAGDHVVAGRTVYHSPDCRLVEGRSDLQAMGVQAATDRGLAPCRICDPAAAESVA